MSIVGRNIPHDSAPGHVSGESIYIDDMPAQKNELIVDFVGSPVARGKIIKIDTKSAEKIEGVVGVFTYKDLDGINKFGPITQDEVLLCEDHVDIHRRTDCCHCRRKLCRAQSSKESGGAGY